MRLLNDMLQQDPVRLKALTCVRKLELPQCYLAAGFIRNMVWDFLHHYSELTPLNDIDVIYFDPHETDPAQYQAYERILLRMMPDVTWQVRNQARMHERNGHPPYLSVIDAMSYWPEKETAVAVRQTGEAQYEWIAAFGFESLLRLEVTFNPRRGGSEVFRQRLNSKAWLNIWPQLTIAGIEKDQATFCTP